jgi:hypothetical protein
MLRWMRRSRSSYATLAVMTLLGLGVANWREEWVPSGSDDVPYFLSYLLPSVPVLLVAGHATVVTVPPRRISEPARRGERWPSLDGTVETLPPPLGVKLTLPPPPSARGVRDLQRGSKLNRALRRLVFWSSVRRA